MREGKGKDRKERKQEMVHKMRGKEMKGKKRKEKEEEEYARSRKGRGEGRKRTKRRGKEKSSSRPPNKTKYSPNSDLIIAPTIA